MGINLQSGSYSFDVNGDGIKDDIHLTFTQSITGEVVAKIDNLVLRDNSGDAIPEEDYFVMMDGQKVSKFFKWEGYLDCGSVTGRIKNIDFFVRKMIMSQTAPAFFPGQVIQSSDEGFVSVVIGTNLTLRNGMVFDDLQCSPHDFAPMAQYFYYWATSEYADNDEERFFYASALGMVGEFELAKEAYKYIAATSDSCYLCAEPSIESSAEKALSFLNEDDVAGYYFYMASGHRLSCDNRLGFAVRLAEMGEIQLAREAYEVNIGYLGMFSSPCKWEWKAFKEMYLSSPND